MRIISQLIFGLLFIVAATITFIFGTITSLLLEALKILDGS